MVNIIYFLGLCTLDALLRSDLSEIQENSFYSSKTTKKDIDPPLAFKYWHDFDEQMKLIKEYVKSRKETKYDRYIQPNSEKCPIPNRISLLGLIKNLGKRLCIRIGSVII